MGFLDRVKQILGVGSEEESEKEEDEGKGESLSGHKASQERTRASAKVNPDARDSKGPTARGRGRGSGRDRERPPLAEAPPPSQSVEDALAAREAGYREEGRRILIEIDRGGGLRTILRAAAALEAGDEDELAQLLPAVAREEPRYKILLQVAAALPEAEMAAPLLSRAEREKAPLWAIAWSKAMSKDDAVRREGLTELLFADAALARTVAARDLGVEGVSSDPEAAARYAAFAHGRDSIRRFGANVVAEVLDRARAFGGP